MYKLHNNLPVEILKFRVENPKTAQKFLIADQLTWTAYLKNKPGFIEKYQWYTNTEPSDIFTIIIWQDINSWKSLDKKMLVSVDQKFKKLFNNKFKKLAFFEERSYHPLRKIASFETDIKTPKSSRTAVEYLVFEVADTEKFLKNDYQIWTKMLASQKGFIKKQILINEDNSSQIHSIVFWDRLTSWQAIDTKLLIQADQEFKNVMPNVKIINSIHEQYEKQIKMISGDFYE